MRRAAFWLLVNTALADCAPQMAQVRLIQFSPEETFLVSYSPVEPSNPREKAGLVLNLFDSRTGRKLRNFAGSAEDYAVGAAAAPGGTLKWPVFQWAGGCGDRRAPDTRLCSSGIGRHTSMRTRRLEVSLLNMRSTWMPRTTVCDERLRFDLSSVSAVQVK